jgi:SAM-dependent methyltransferase
VFPENENGRPGDRLIFLQEASIHVIELLQMENTGQKAIPCRVCLSQNTEYLCTTHNEHSKTSNLDHYRCRDCGTVYVGNDIDTAELGAAYGSLDSTRYYAEIEAENRKKMATAIADMDELVSKNDSIIDLGTGNGMFVEMLHEHGFENISAHEIKGSDLSAIEGLARHIYQDFDYSGIPPNAFDAVTLLDVVEHVPDPGYLFRACARILKPGGVIYFHTPAVTKTDRFMHFVQKVPGIRKAGEIWQRGRTSVFHLQNYTPGSLTQLLEKAGFAGIEIKVRNELSWPVSSYVKIYLLEKQGLPGSLAPFIAPFAYPFLSTDLFNSNKAIVTARKPL